MSRSRQTQSKTIKSQMRHEIWFSKVRSPHELWFGASPPWLKGSALGLGPWASIVWAFLANTWNMFTSSSERHPRSHNSFHLSISCSLVWIPIFSHWRGYMFPVKRSNKATHHFSFQGFKIFLVTLKHVH